MKKKKTLSYTPKSIANNPRSIEKAIESLNAKKKKRKRIFKMRHDKRKKFYKETLKKELIDVFIFFLAKSETIQEQFFFFF